ncbi:MAG TPA: hypothetical protein VK641_02160 [Terriglobales bacterium]|nr:hypothetical protein [Terriglobales bacterium]
MMMLEDLRLALRQICQAIGLQGDAATVASLIVLGVALNLTALRAVEFVGIGGHACHNRTDLQSAAQTELKVVRTVMVSTLKKIGDGGWRLCLERQWMMGKQTKGTGNRTGVGSDGGVPTEGKGCDVMVVSRYSRRMTITFVQC